MVGFVCVRPTEARRVQKNGELALHFMALGFQYVVHSGLLLVGHVLLSRSHFTCEGLL